MEKQDLIPNHAAKSFYIFMCSILGALLLVILQRALSLIYLLLLDSDYSRFSFGLDAQTLWIINYFTFAAAIILGLWYGIWLGLHWYKIVYEDGHGGLFHGFKGHWLGHEGVIKPTSLNQKNQPRPSMPVSITPKSNPAPIPGSVSSSKTIQPVARLSDRSNNGESLKSWEFDDIIKQKTIINTAGAKSRTAVKKSGTVASAKAVAKPKPKSGVTTKSSLVRKTTKKAVDKS